MQLNPPEQCPACGRPWDITGPGRPHEKPVNCPCEPRRWHTAWECPCGIIAAEDCTDPAQWSRTTVPVGLRPDQQWTVPGLE